LKEIQTVKPRGFGLAIYSDFGSDSEKVIERVTQKPRVK
jgi:hypothetical protein